MNIRNEHFVGVFVGREGSYSSLASTSRKLSSLKKIFSSASNRGSIVSATLMAVRLLPDPSRPTNTPTKCSLRMFIRSQMRFRSHAASFVSGASASGAGRFTDAIA